jgi:hypothetical protein
MNVKALCLICTETVTVLKDYNIAKRYISKHKEKYKNFVHALRREKLEALKRGLGHIGMSSENNSMIVPLHCWQVTVLLICRLQKGNFLWWEILYKMLAAHSAKDLSGKINRF